MPSQDLYRQLKAASEMLWGTNRIAPIKGRQKVKDIFKDNPEFAQRIQDRNTDVSNNMYDELQYYLDDNKLSHPASNRALADAPYTTKIPFGFEDTSYLTSPNEPRGMYGTTVNNKDSYVPGLFNIPTIAHEGLHRKFPSVSLLDKLTKDGNNLHMLEEAKVRAVDFFNGLYGDKELESSARNWFKKEAPKWGIKIDVDTTEGKNQLLDWIIEANNLE